MSDVARLRGIESETYVSDIVTSVRALSKRLEDSSFFSFQELTDFAKKYNWDLTRLAPKDVTANIIRTQLERIAHTYAQFTAVRDAKNPLDNKEYFDDLTLSTDSGLPYFGALSDLELAATDKEARLGRLPTYESAAQDLCAALEGDELSPDSVRNLVARTACDARKRNFIETLDASKLFGNSTENRGRSLIVNKVQDLGVETLYNVSVISYSKASGLVHIYEVDAWQDNASVKRRDKHIQFGDTPKISDEFMSMFNFADANRSWFMLDKIDQTLEGVHPVHVSRFTVGPMDSQYRMSSQEKPFYGKTAAILKADPQARIFQAKREYTYAPNTQVVGNEVRQKVEQDVWYDTFLVCPKKYAAEMNGSIQGSRLFVLEK